MSDSNPAVDQRRCRRMPVDIACEIASDAWDGMVAMRLTDLSLEGAFVETELPLHVGSEVVVQVHPPGEQNVRILAEVRRVDLPRRRQENAQRCGMAISFAYVARRDHATLQRWLGPR